MQRIFDVRSLPDFLVCIGSFACAAQSPMPSQANLPVPQGAALELPSFEVAAIKPSRAGGNLESINTPPGRLQAKNASVESLLEQAYNLPQNQISGGPSWLYSDRYDIEAKMSDSQYRQIEKLDKRQQEHQVNLMLQSLLTDRFKLSVTHQPRELKAFALVVAKCGPKLHLSGTPEPAKPGRSKNSGMSFYGVVLQTRDSPLAEFALHLSEQFGRPVIDRTGLKGSYDISFQVPLAPEDDRESAVSSALQDQLGLKITTQKATVDTIVIHYIEAPSEN